MLQQMQRFAATLGSIGGSIAACGLSLTFAAQPAQSQKPLPQQPLVDEFVLKDTIQPVTQGELVRAIARANSDGAQALLVVMDTPGGLLDSTRTMAGAILASRVPVIVYVTPAGARAAPLIRRGIEARLREALPHEVLFEGHELVSLRLKP